MQLRREGRRQLQLQGEEEEECRSGKRTRGRHAVTRARVQRLSVTRAV